MTYPNRTEFGWFTVEYIDEDTIAISEYGHWEQAHSYIVRDRDESILIDSGLGIGSISSVVNQILGMIPPVVTSHVHWDHIGGHSEFDHITVPEIEENWLKNGIPGLPTEEVIENLVTDLSKPLPESFDIDLYEIHTDVPNDTLSDGDILSVGDRSLSVIHTPGHSPGHLSFHEPGRGYLFTGDVLYADTIFADYPTTDPKSLKTSILRLADLDEIETVLPSHHAIPQPKSLLDEAVGALESLEEQGVIEHGTGTHDFQTLSFRF